MALQILLLVFINLQLPVLGQNATPERIQQNVNDLTSSVLNLLNPFTGLQQASEFIKESASHSTNNETGMATTKVPEGAGLQDYDTMNVRLLFERQVKKLEMTCASLTICPKDLPWNEGISGSTVMGSNIISEKIAKLFVLKIILAIKIAFIKFILLKKLLLVKAKLLAIKMAKGALIIFPVLVPTIMKGLGIFKFFTLGLVAALKKLDYMLHNYGNASGQSGNLNAEETLVLQLLPWFAQSRETLSPVDIIRTPASLFSMFVPSTDALPTPFNTPVDAIFPDLSDILFRQTPSAAFNNLLFPISSPGGGIYSSFSQYGNPFYGILPVSFGEAAGRMFLPVGVSDAGPMREMMQDIVNDFMGGFAGAMNFYEEVVREYQAFVESSRGDPQLTARTLKDELEHYVLLPPSSMAVINTTGDMYVQQDDTVTPLMPTTLQSSPMATTADEAATITTTAGTPSPIAGTPITATPVTGIPIGPATPFAGIPLSLPFPGIPLYSAPSIPFYSFQRSSVESPTSMTSSIIPTIADVDDALRCLVTHINKIQF